jgi:hypothetical protein
MWAYVHTFPEGYRPQPKVTFSQGAVVTLTKNGSDKSEKITSITVESGTIDLLNVHAAGAGGQTLPAEAMMTVPPAGAIVASSIKVGNGAVPIQVLAPEVLLSNTHETARFGVEGVPLALKAGVQVRTKDVAERFAPSAFNPAHTRLIARSDKAKPMAVNMYSAWWSFVVCVLVTIGVSLVTKPKPDAELANLVMGLTPLPTQDLPWYRKPVFWAGVVAVVLVAINVIFWQTP